MLMADSIGTYLIKRLYEHGVHHIFGVPGDYVLGFDKLLENSPIQFINTCDEQGAGFAADAYARLRGLGAVCITYCVGGFKVINTTAQAYAEKSPVVIISGAPGINERIQHPLLHHKVKDFNTQYKIFQELTIASTVLDDPNKAFEEIDRVLATALRYKRPVYIEIPRDMLNQPGNRDYQWIPQTDVSDPTSLAAALEETVKLINAAHQPVILADVEIHRFGLQQALLQLTETTNIPVADTILGKSVINELHTNYLGLYAGALGSEFARQYVESSDCVIMLGVFLMDLNLGMFTAHLDPNCAIYVMSEKTSIQCHEYQGIRLQDFVQGLLQTDIRFRELSFSNSSKPATSFSPIPDQLITIKRLFEQLNIFINKDMIVIADIGDSLFGGLDLFVHGKTRFLSPAYYASLGFAVPGAIGVQFANPHIRPLVLVGDGAFQMTGVELSTIARYGLNPIVIVLNNGGYATERPLLDGKFNNIRLWQYSRISEVVGAGRRFDVHTESELEAALLESRSHPESFCILDVHIGSDDMSPALQRMTNELAKKIH
ncbi:alpha-keto acid decarboxylase family protein [Brasilonema octagenarum UFV-E1]|uniref:Alpha-keto-acid decarboxylase n=1 Tax=Brasilonema sennae CENA114 TaxID=415709 RepID=A0A856M6K9_9CYAN|nr:thiamine pyrophosphate-binding protein [Brasilonema sennae]QDL06785.1 alpha-keto acid decarboxylase family protein [Brasilonema sennae CENA114]QDL13154.1 alpha-keto acid decarboxylase family protein [Brasilonema octagenarum UFV-E1]